MNRSFGLISDLLARCSGVHTREQVQNQATSNHVSRTDRDNCGNWSACCLMGRLPNKRACGLSTDWRHGIDARSTTRSRYKRLFHSELSNWLHNQNADRSRWRFVWHFAHSAGGRIATRDRNHGESIMSVEISIAFDNRAVEKLRQIPVLLRLKASERILTAMAKPIVARAAIIAPSSVKSGSRKKWSKNTADKWSQREGRNHIGYVYRKSERGGYLVIGGKDPYANSFNFDSSEEGRKVVYWGKDTGKIKRIAPSERFMQKAFDETRAAQVTAGNSQLEKELRELNLG